MLFEAKAALEASESARAGLTTAILDILMHKMSTLDMNKIVHEVEDKVHLGLLGDDPDSAEVDDLTPFEVLDMTLRKMDTRVKKAKKVDEERQKAPTAKDEDPKQKLGILVAASGGNTVNTVGLVRKRKADAIE
ncbi:hypothetical protein K505DRAFT_322176 [Melanomma pulvis-pyrius CBS 109.77]|uniref:Uncharacterized protein n=1 Tax=Melanomma pulvis-pyrius CBS 109.77 TaxID=1314802 RepID=A0A6A6XPA5_9PLEO|nr:hypothetical protein K505DRAFT_322176 [Melanomma pulvis-pyrius CBS 109.77]